MKADATTCIFADPAPHVGPGTSASVALPVCRPGPSRVTYLLASWAQWHSGLDLSSFQEAGKTFCFLLASRGKQTPFNTVNASSVISSAVTRYSFSYFCLCFLWKKRQGKPKDLAPLKAVTQPWLSVASHSGWRWEFWNDLFIYA